MLLRRYLSLLLPIAASATTFTVSDRGSAFASLHVKLDAGESMQSEPGALVKYSGDLRLGIRSSSGWLGRIFAGEAPWTTSISATSTAGECMLCPYGIGDIKILELASDEAICLSAGCFLAADSTVAVTSEFHSSLSRTLFSGTGMRYLVCAGPGVCAFNGHGSMVKRSLWQCPKLGCCAGRAWRLWAAKYALLSRGGSSPLHAMPPPRVLELAAPKVASSTASDPPGMAGFTAASWRTARSSPWTTAISWDGRQGCRWRLGWPKASMAPSFRL